ncbi:hypothetical protein [Streptomyces sp. AP-93]|uniref:hypothetical protein n=1 Tax=Streptomyces sp. AP-93 TaxID=2929048 RepID=UPI001FAFB778|nr:hypothetical protein [Streptomyces sp. AP-93]MCJ0875015.1 hypothetical protein [Streptomyces sp. AP-93]
MSEKRSRRLGTGGVVGLVVCVAALAVGGWFVYGAYEIRQDSRAEITEACEGLVDPDAVMRFGGGGRKVDSTGTGGQVCVLRRAVTFEGQEEMAEYFSLKVVASKDAEPGESRFDLGIRSVEVTAKCADPVKAAGVTSLRVTAVREGDLATRGEPGALAALAREAALRAAAKAGCETTLPAAPTT